MSYIFRNISHCSYFYFYVVNSITHIIIIKDIWLWLVWLSWLECQPITKRLQVRFPVQAPTIPLSCIHVYLCSLLSPFLSL